MKEFIKENWFKITVLLITTIIVCFYIFGYLLPKQKQVNLFYLRESCSKNASGFLKRHIDEKSKYNDYTLINTQHHYNQKENICYMTISDVFTGPFKINNFQIIIYDVLEGQVLGAYTKEDDKDYCYLNRRIRESCSSRNEFNSLIKPLMEN